MDIFTFATVFLFFAGGVNTQVLVPSEALVLQNSDARFNCSTKPGWSVMNWSVNGRLALSIIENSGPVSSSDHYSARNYSTANNPTWGFIINNVTLNDSGTVDCQVLTSLLVSATLTVQVKGTVTITGSNRTATVGDQVTFTCLAANWLPVAQLSWSVNGIPVNSTTYNANSMANVTLMSSNSTLSITAASNVSVACLASISALPSPEISTVFLTVQDVKPKNQTVLIAITVAFSLAALLVLIIIGIIFFCNRRKRKRSRYQEEARAHSTRYNRTGRVRENLGYVEDSPSVNNFDGVYTISGFPRDKYGNNLQLPEMNSNIYSSSASYDGYSSEDPGIRKPRHVTIL